MSGGEFTISDIGGEIKLVVGQDSAFAVAIGPVDVSISVVGVGEPGPAGEGGTGSSDTAEGILAKLITVDGTGSGLDADLLDGQHASAFAAAGHNHDSAYDPLGAATTAVSSHAAAAGAHPISGVIGLQTALDGKSPTTHTHAGVYDPAGTAAAAVAAHEAASDPHPQYLTPAEGNAAYAPVAQGVTGGDAHDHSGGDGAQIAYTSLSGLPTIPAAQVNSDWAASSGVAQILNKPTLGTAAAAATTDFDAAGAATSAVSAHAAGTGVHTIAGVSGLQTALDGKSATTHNHDSAYDALGAASSAVSTHAAVTSGVHGISTFGASLVDDASASAARTTLGLGTAATQNTGTAAGNVVQLDGSGKLPAVDGSQLTNISGGGGGSVPTYVSTPAIVLCKTLFGGL